MNSPILGRCIAKSPREIKKQKLQQVKLANGYHAEWQNSNELSVLCEDEDINQVISVHQDKVTGVMALRHKNNKGLFLSIGLDNIVQVFKFYGENIATLDEHDDIILGVFELKNGDVVTVSQDKTLRFWNIHNGACKSVIDASVTDCDAIQFFSNIEELAVKESDGISIWRFSGEHVIKLKGQKKLLSYLYGLTNGNWLIWCEGENPSLWSGAGTCLKRFNFYFSYESGFVVREDQQQLLIHSDDGQLSLWRTDGEELDRHIKCNEMSDLFLDLVTCEKQVNSHIKKHSTIHQYVHKRNFFGSQDSKSYLMPSEQISEQKLTFDNDEKQKELWDFFHRPIPRLLTTAMKKEVKVARSAEKSLRDKIDSTQIQADNHARKRRRNKVISVIMLFITMAIVSVGAFFSTHSNAPELFNNLLTNYLPDYRPLRLDAVVALFSVSAGIVFFLCIVFFAKNRGQKRKQLTQTANLAILNTMLPAFYQIIHTVKLHRAKLWRSVPLKTNRHLYNGESVTRIMQDIIKNKLEKLGLDECGLEKSDVTYSNHEAIVLSDWALIQSDEKRSNVFNKLNKENEFSFWADKDGSLIFAVQYIQFIFLTADKIDLFTTFYDFIGQKCIGKEANAFYYKDVTNITKREVDRPSGFNGDSISATEISLSVASSDKIRLTILNEESLKSIVEAAEKVEEKEKVSDHAILMELNARKKQIEQDTDMDEDEREEELDSIEIQINAMNRANTDLDSDVSTSKADEAIKNIRSQIRHHKQDQNEDNVSEL